MKALMLIKKEAENLCDLASGARRCVVVNVVAKRQNGRDIFAVSVYNCRYQKIIYRKE